MSRSRARCRRRSPATSPPTACTRIIDRLNARTRGLTSLQLARLLRDAAVEKKAWDPVVLDVRDKTSVADYFVVCEGETDRQVRAIADAMVEAARAKQLKAIAVDGYGDATWVLLDFDAVLAHVFLPGERSYYDLESLWAPAAKRRRNAASG
ncbi:ribosome silencing factor [bacterium]|nr:MAG: ribosome silencing factor [bacterium]